MRSSVDGQPANFAHRATRKAHGLLQALQQLADDEQLKARATLESSAVPCCALG